MSKNGQYRMARRQCGVSGPVDTGRRGRALRRKSGHVVAWETDRGGVQKVTLGGKENNQERGHLSSKGRIREKEK